ncbi:MAG: peptidyl-prolyl cis-trans isomerase [Proteobacteria bacterium]|nr:peptidyl-prolyl cis-trans isomerase [Pseudomonadota bacterium]
MKKLLSLFLIGLIASFSAFAAPILIKMETNRGDIIIELNQDKAPLSVANFLAYAKEGYYDGTVFHRVISNFMIQGGGFDEELTRKPTKPAIQNEASNGLKNTRGTIAMARTGAPHSATSQFFINVQDNPSLDFTSEDNGRTWGYAIFGKVLQGMDVVDEIRFTPTGPNPPIRSNVPIKTMLIKSVTVIDSIPSIAKKTADTPEPDAEKK